MRKLLEVYKKCRYMDRLMNTSFFHEDKFQGLIERVRRVSTTTTTVGRVLDHKSRLFKDTQVATAASAIITSTPGRIKSKVCLQGDQEIPRKQIICEPEIETLGTSSDDDERKLTAVRLNPIDVTLADESCSSDFDATATPPPPPPPGTNEASFGNYPSKLFGFVMNNIDNASKETDDLCRWSTNQLDSTHYCQHHQHHASKLKSNSNSADSGNHTKTEWGENSCASDVINTSVGLAVKPNNSTDDHTSNSCCSIEMTSGEELPKCGCARLCALIKAQLVMALKEINERFSQVNNSLSEAIVIDSTMSLVTDDVVPPVPLTKEMLDNCLDTSDELLMPDSTSGEEADSSSRVSSPPVITASIPPSDCFIVLESAPQSHTYQLTLFQPLNAQLFYRTVRFDHKLLQTALPPGVWVR